MQWNPFEYCTACSGNPGFALRVSSVLEKGCLCCSGTRHNGCEKRGAHRNPHAASEFCRSRVFVWEVTSPGRCRIFLVRPGITLADLLAVEEGWSDRFRTCACQKYCYSCVTVTVLLRPPTGPHRELRIYTHSFATAL